MARKRSPQKRPVPPGKTAPELPPYMEEVYTWAYVNPNNVILLDRETIVNAILFGNAGRLTRAVLREISRGDHVLQPASVYGRHLYKIAKQVGTNGKLDVLDITPVQVDRWGRNLKAFPHVTVYHADAEAPPAETYDVVNMFFLLHELPDPKKTRVVDAALNCLKPGGKAIFTDYHRPHPAHPLRLPLQAVNRILEPFAESLWRHEIRTFASEDASCAWSTELFFGGMYQQTIAYKEEP